MSSRNDRPAVGGGSAEVVSIGAGGSYRPDYTRLACGQVAAARRLLGMDREQFSRHVRDLTGWDVLPGAIAAWEADETPPGDLVMACLSVTQGAPEVKASLLATVPPAFPVSALAGAWVTSYEFTHGGAQHHHADIAHITAEPAGRVRAVNHPPEPRSEGRLRSFRNEITAQLAGRHLVGEWQNTSDLRYCGALHLAVLPGEAVMQGWYTGVGSDIEVSRGLWRWVRLDPGPDGDLAAIKLRDPAELHDLVMTHTQIDVPLTLAAVKED